MLYYNQRASRIWVPAWRKREADMEKSEKSTGFGRAAILASALLWGLAGVCVKEIDGWPTTSIVAVRSFLSLLIITAAKLIRDRSLKIQFSLRNIGGAAAAAATGLLYVQSIKMTTAGTAIVLQYVAPILVLLWSVLFAGRRLKLYEALITAAVFGGIILSFADSLEPGKIVGNFLGLASGVTFAAQIIIMNDAQTDSLDSMWLSSAASLLLSLPFAFAVAPDALNAHNLIWLVILGIFQYGGGNLLFALGIPRTDGIEASLLLNLEPVFNPIPVALIYGEKMGPLAIAGSIIVIAFVALYGALPAIRRRFSEEKE